MPIQVDTAYIVAACVAQGLISIVALIIYMRVTMLSRREHTEICVKKDEDTQAAIDKLAVSVDRIDSKQDAAVLVMAGVAKDVAVLAERMEWLKNTPAATARRLK